jgi:hypothetical protein
LTSNILSKEKYEDAKNLIFIGQKRDFNNVNTSNLTIGIDYNTKRQKIAQCVYDKGAGDFIGKRWNEISGIKSSGFALTNENRWNSILKILDVHPFNIGLESTVWKSYFYEKSGHSITAGFFAVYWLKDFNIYDTFPIDSFIDGSEFKNSNDFIVYPDNLPHE